MSLATKKKKAESLGLKFEDDIKEEKLDELIEDEMKKVAQQKEEDKIKKDAEKKAADEEKGKKIILQDVDGHDVDQADYFFPDLEKKNTQTAPSYFNKICGVPVDREELIDVFNLHFPRSKGFLFYRLRDREVYLVIVPLKYATTVTKDNEARPGDFQRHAMSFIAEGSVNLDSLKMKLARIAKHSSISSEPLA